MTDNAATITFIGGGNMATALIGGLAASASIRVSEPDAERRQRLERDYAVTGFTDNAAAINGADVVVLAVKPQVLPDVATACAPAVAHTAPLVVSIAAGVTTAALEKWLGGATSIVRVMPNTPALVGRGAAGLYANAHVNDTQRELANRIMAAAGEVLWIDDEALMDAVTATSGSGPAYFFLFMELMTQTATQLGLSSEAATQLVVQTALGAATMVKEGEADMAELRRRVTSPGGTTAAALAVFEQGGLGDLVEQALTAARDRGRELAG